MKLPSLDQITGAALSTLKRFPFPIANAVLGSAAAIALVHWDGEKTDIWWSLNNVYITATLGIALLIAAAFVGERLKWNRLRTIGLQLAGVIVLILYGMTLPHDIYSPPYSFGIRHWMLLAGVHLLVAFGPFFKRGEVNGFWHFNKVLFLRSLTAALFSAVLWAGLAIALAAISHLFDITIKGERYLELWIFIAGIFNTWFFLSNLPENLDLLESETAYPKALKIFTQYVLIPLVVIYVLILYAYIVKIVVEWNWPKGWVANLILGFSITGIFSLLLVHPIRDRIENVWIKRFAKWYYIAEVPLVIVLLTAIWRRVSEYGITENRYIVLLLGVWLAVIVLYFLMSKTPSIKAIPASLCVGAFLVSFGPWGAFQVSERSQVNRLEKVLAEAGLLKNGAILKAQGGSSYEQSREISSIVRYLYDTHGLNPIQRWFSVHLDTVGGGSATERSGEKIPKLVVTELLGVEYIPEWQTKKTDLQRYTASQPGTYDIKGFDRMYRVVNLQGHEAKATPATFPFGTGKLLKGKLMLTLSDGENSPDSLALDLAPLVRTLSEQFKNPNEIPGSVLMVEGKAERSRVRLYLNWILAQSDKDSVKISMLDGDLLVGRLPESEK